VNQARADDPSGPIVFASWVGTAGLSSSAVGAVLWPSVFTPMALGVAVFLFVTGVVVFAWAYATAVARSRTDELSLVGLFLLSGSGPSNVRRHLLGSLAVQIAVALGTAGARPYSSLAFGVLSPMFGLALTGLWGARHGAFPPRRTPTDNRAD
jgi:hypothetical protein